MSGYQAPVLILKKCAHGRTQWERCIECDQERDARHEEERARVQGPAWVIEQAIKKRKRWFDGCAFCPDETLIAGPKHGPACPFKNAMGEAVISYALHKITESDRSYLRPTQARSAKGERT